MRKRWVKIHRSLLDWQWYDDDKAFRLLMHLILTVNYEDKKWKGIIVESGSIILSWDTLSLGVKMTKQQCRTAMSKLEKCGEVTRKTTNKYQVVTLVKWEQMQIKNTQVTDKLTGEQQTSNRQVTPTKETKQLQEDKKEENIYPFFEDFWNLYDKKNDKPKSLNKWNKLSQEVKEKIMIYIPKYKISQPDKKFRKNPITFLNNESWNNEIEVKKKFKPTENLPF